ncbi:hypothetical protein [Paenibacillus faecalis]|uniref:hypothetical protein n=1 Tax=Paenibacillus faecalis TaxID=2079532 RepID=UPI000D0E53B6|nr:hypothetical protein [Paenibacillus faecalis]
MFVMPVIVGSNYGDVLSSASSDIMLTNYNNSYVGSVSSLYVRDVGDYGNGRDLQVSFKRPSNEYNISHYRAFVVKSHKANNFDIYDANKLSSYYSTDIYKTGGNTVTQSLSSSSRDTDGDPIRDGVSYRVFIMSVGYGNYSGNNVLSSSSSIITLSNNHKVDPVTQVTVTDVNDLNDGRDLMVSFRRPADYYNIDHYRIFVVKANDPYTFDLSRAKSIRNDKYTYVSSKSDSTISLTLDSNAKDIDGDKVKNGTDYRVYVMSVGGSSYAGSSDLSPSSKIIKLESNSPVKSVTGLKVIDDGDRNDGRDMLISFNKLDDEDSISHYQIYVVKSGRNFDLELANKKDNYTHVPKKGTDISISLSYNATDIDNEEIKNSIDYDVYVLSVSKDGNPNNNALSEAAPITLKGSEITAPSIVEAKIDENKTGFDITFEKPKKSENVKEYRVMVVPSDDTNPFEVKDASDVPANYYKRVGPDAAELKVNIQLGSKDAKGNSIVTNTKYKVYVLAVNNGQGAGGDALSNHAIVEIKDPTTETEPNPLAASSVKVEYIQKTNNLEVSFIPSKDSSIVSYQVMFILESDADSFTLEKTSSSKTANNLTSMELTQVKEDVKDKTDTETDKLVKYTVEMPNKDVYGQQIQSGKKYKARILSVVNKADKLTEVVAVSKPSNAVVLKPADPATQTISK